MQLTCIHPTIPDEHAGIHLNSTIIALHLMLSSCFLTLCRSSTNVSRFTYLEMTYKSYDLICHF